MLKICKASFDQIDEIMKVYAYAKKFMIKTGNPTQWDDTYPSKELIKQDIKQGHFYVGVDENDEVHCAFAFIIGKDKCYEKIEYGKWLNDEKYGTIHRIASDGEIKGIFETCLKFCQSIISNIRIDTHKDNKIMQHLIEKNGFSKCGIVYMEDNTQRIAYQLQI